MKAEFQYPNSEELCDRRRFTATRLFQKQPRAWDDRLERARLPACHTKFLVVLEAARKRLDIMNPPTYPSEVGSSAPCRRTKFPSKEGQGWGNSWRVPQALCTIVTLAAWWTLAANAQSPAPDAEQRFRPDRILVKLKDNLSSDTIAKLHSRHRTKVLRRFKGFGNVDVLNLPAGALVSDLLQKYQASGMVERAEPDYWLRAAVTPNDPRFTDGTLWNLRNTGQNGGTAGADIRAVSGWDALNSAGNIAVAVIDSGVRYTHQDLAANMWVNPGESGLDSSGRDKRTNGLDDDGNGFADDVHGIDSINNTGNPSDSDGHGTHVAGIIGATGNNRAGVVGVAWAVQIMACKFLSSSGYGSTSDAIQCIDYARAEGARIINASWGDTGNSSFLQSAIRRARDAGIIFVTAAGNETSDNDRNPYYPAAFNLDNIVSVAATTRTDALASFSNFGATTVDLAAPGAPIYSTFNTSDSAYTYISGTSMSAPHVTGAMALLMAQHPAESYRQIIDRVLATTDPLPSLAGKCVTGGRLNLERALTAKLAADFTASPLAGTPPLSVVFRNSSIGENLNYEWDFGDGTAKSSEPSPVHPYASEGNFQATLTVTDPEGNTSRKSRTISAVANYQMQTTTFNWIDPSAMTALSLSDNGVSAAQPLPYNFTYYGQNYDRLYVGANGLVAFANQRLETTENTDLPSAGAPNAIVCPWWDDLNPPSGGKVRIGTIGSAPNRRTVISWVTVPHRQSSTYSFTFQAVLSESANEILFQYLEVQASRTRGAGRTATVGIENETGLVGKRYSLDGSTLLRNSLALRFVPLSAGGIAVSPVFALNASGPVGGPFAPSSQTYTVQNTSRASVDWAVRNGQNWLSISTMNGTLLPGQNTNVTVTIAASAQTLPAGTYLDTFEFVNLNNGNGNTSRSVSLAVNGTNPALEVTPPAGLSSSGFAGGPFIPSTQIFTLLNSGDATLDWTVESAEDWIAISPGRGTLTAGDSATVTASINSSANALPDGSYSSLIAFKNLTNGKGSTERRASLAVISPTAVLKVSPPEGFEFAGFLGGPFQPASAEIALENPSDASLEWTAVADQPWLTLSTTSGRLAAGQAALLSISINPNVSTLAPGRHKARLSFATTGGAASASVEIMLTVHARAALTATAFGPDNRILRMRVAGAPSQTYVVETSNDLVRWIPIATNVISLDGFFEINDLDTKSSPQQFYRAILAP
ncbi:MAG: S8 family serine peptidase [Verrucomicrobia bacterium]|nr:S8 family serine peptidase [Verrucomicrobiota bacterium]